MFTPQESVLLVIDVQGKLAHLMFEKEKLFKNIQALIRMASFLEIPIFYTEQVPEKIGPTIPEIANHLHNLSPIRKASFSCFLEENFLKKLKSYQRHQIIVCGIETHVCVYQTAADLLEDKYEVQVVTDAVSSRTEENKKAALERLKSFGAQLTSMEMLACELLRTSEHKKFKEVLGLIK